MTKPETALSAVVERTFPLSEFGDDLHDYLQRGLRDVLYADLTALISEHYYPKEFTEWAIGLGRSAFDDRYYHYISVQNPNMPFKETKELEFDDLDDAFNYWKENVQ